MLNYFFKTHNEYSTSLNNFVHKYLWLLASTKMKYIQHTHAITKYHRIQLLVKCYHIQLSVKYYHFQ